MSKEMDVLDQLSRKLTTSIGTPISILVHTVLFIGIFALYFLGISFDQILLILTTAVSLEAIYLAIFIQMSVNRTAVHIVDVKEDISDIQEDVEDIQEDVDDLEENIDDIQEDVDSLESNVKEISEDYDEEEGEEDEVTKALKDIENRLSDLQKDIDILKKKGLLK